MDSQRRGEKKKRQAQSFVKGSAFFSIMAALKTEESPKVFENASTTKPGAFTLAFTHNLLPERSCCPLLITLAVWQNMVRLLTTNILGAVANDGVRPFLPKVLNGKLI